MNLFKKNEEDIKVIYPPNLGWLEKKLSEKEIDYLWRCINNPKESQKYDLAGNISESLNISDRSDWFFTNTILPLSKKYHEEFGNLGDNVPTNLKHPYYLKTFWVNYQKQNEYNPLHKHDGIYSFVIWMKIPTKHHEQNKNPIAKNSNAKKISTFNFYYSTILGEIKEFEYKMNPDVEGTIVFFPSKLNHCVYPFYNCDEDRISISGNISLNTAKVL